MNRHFASFAFAALLVPSVSLFAETDFNREIRPILNKHCTGCHGGVKQADHRRRQAR